MFIQSEMENTKATEIDSEIVINVDVPDEELSLMQKVLFNKVEFYGTISVREPAYGWYKIENLTGIYGKDDTFGVVDLDKDGEEEVFVYYRTGDTMIFHEEDGVVYGYARIYNGFHDVTTNGTFWNFYGRHDYCNMNVSFDKSEMRFAYVHKEFQYDTEEMLYTKGIVVDSESGWNIENEISIMKAQWNDAVSNHTKGEYVELYPLTVENVLMYVN